SSPSPMWLFNSSINRIIFLLSTIAFIKCTAWKCNPDIILFQNKFNRNDHKPLDITRDDDNDQSYMVASCGSHYRLEYREDWDYKTVISEKILCKEDGPDEFKLKFKTRTGWKTIREPIYARCVSINCAVCEYPRTPSDAIAPKTVDVDGCKRLTCENGLHLKINGLPPVKEYATCVKNGYRSSWEGLVTGDRITERDKVQCVHTFWSR
ncbi:hypothetical protein PFISCL1PPCAC_7155, partial [Pristionchus fissidentatus]